MKIVLAAGLYAPDIGGPATFAKQLVDFLHTKDVEVAVVPFRVVRGLPPLVRHLVYGWYVWRASRKAAYIIALDPVSVGLPALVAATVRRVPFILRVGGDYAWEQGVQRFGVTDTLDVFASSGAKRIFSTRGTYVFAVRLLASIQTFVARRAERVVVPSGYLKTIVERWGIRSLSVVRIYSSTDVDVSLPQELSKNEARKEFGFGREKVIVSAGRFVPWKGFPVLIDAVKMVRQEFPDARLIIAGSGPDEARIKAHAAEVLGDHVQFVGNLPKKRMLALTASADIFALNTGYEGLSHQLIEAMAAAIPIVTTSVGGNPELIEDGVSGRLVPFNSVDALAHALIETLRDHAKAARMAKAARARVETFSSTDAMAAWAVLVGLGEDGMRVLMLSGDAHALDPDSGVYKRLLLQAGQVGWLEVYARGSSRELSLGTHGIVRGFSGSKFGVAWRMLRRSMRLRPQVVTAQDPFFLGLLAWRIAKRAKAALQLQLHTNLFAPEYQAQYRLNVRLARFLLPKAQGVRVVTAHIGQLLRAQVPDVSVSVLPVFVDAHAVAAAHPSKLFSAYTKSKKRILIVARLEPEKRVDDLLRLFVPLLREVSGAGVFIVGDGSQKASLQGLAASLGIADRVVFVGFRHDVFSLYKSADLVIAATASYEGYGASTVEALCAGVPVLSLDVGVAREAGATIYTPETFVALAREALERSRVDGAALSLPTPGEWAGRWRAGVEACMVEPS